MNSLIVVAKLALVAALIAFLVIRHRSRAGADGTATADRELADPDPELGAPAATPRPGSADGEVPADRVVEDMDHSADDGADDATDIAAAWDAIDATEIGADDAMVRDTTTTCDIPTARTWDDAESTDTPWSAIGTPEGGPADAGAARHERTDPPTAASADPAAPVIMHVQAGEDEMKVVIERDHTGTPVPWVLSGQATVEADGQTVHVRIAADDPDGTWDGAGGTGDVAEQGGHVGAASNGSAAIAPKTVPESPSSARSEASAVDPTVGMLVERLAEMERRLERISADTESDASGTAADAPADGEPGRKSPEDLREIVRLVEETDRRIARVLAERGAGPGDGGAARPVDRPGHAVDEPRDRARRSL